MLNQEEKRALRDKQKLLFSSGQFPLQGGSLARKRALRSRRSPLRTVLAIAAGILLVLIALVVLLTRAARADEGDAGPAEVDFEVDVTGVRPAPGVLFVGGGHELLRARMHALALEAGRPNASIEGTATVGVPAADVHVVATDVTHGLVSRAAIGRATKRAAAGLGRCYALVDKPSRVRLTLQIDATGRASRIVVPGSKSKVAADRQRVTCVQSTLSAARWPAPTVDDGGVANADLVIDLWVRPGRVSDGASSR